MVNPIRIAIVGCGWAGQHHARACAQQNIQISWAIDLDATRAKALAIEHPGARVSADLHDALGDPGVEAIDICLPHNLHAPVAIAAARAGKHVLCEKPLAANLDEADDMIAASAKAGSVLMVAENVRYEPLYQRIAELLRKDAIGAPALLQMTRQCYLARSFTEDRPWFLDQQAAAGGIMMSGGIHDFETMRMLLGEIESVAALRAPQRFLEMGGDDTSIAQVRFANGVVGTLVESFLMKDLTTASGPEVHTLRIDGALGSLTCLGDRTLHLYSEHSDYARGGELVQHDIHVPAVDTFALLLADFVTAVRTGREPLTSARSQRRPLEIVMAAYRSMETNGQPVAL